MKPPLSWYPNQTKILPKRKLQANVFDEYRYKNISKTNPTTHKNDQMTKLDSSQGHKNGSTYARVNVIYHINKRQDKNHMIISIDAEKIIYDKPIANIILNGEKLKAFPLNSETRKGHPLSPLFFNIVLEIVATAVRQEMKSIQVGREEVKFLLNTDDRLYTYMWVCVYTCIHTCVCMCMYIYPWRLHTQNY